MELMLNTQKSKIIFVVFLFLLLPVIASADDLGQRVNFYIDDSYDLTKRTQAIATLQKITDQIYFYLDDSWWNPLTSAEKQEVSNSLSALSQEFEQKIYPTLTLNFGSEWKPGIDNDSRITILFHPMVDEAGGYFNSGDEYSRVQVSASNQREMIYLNTKYLNTSRIKSFTAHEFVHLITFNQKEKIQGAQEESWLNEARAEIAPTLLGYDENYQDSNLQSRVRNFLDNPRNSLTEWQGKTSDYGTINIFTQYLLDYYGKEILNDSLKSKKTGIPSINEALLNRGFKEDFSQIFTNWTIAVFINDCSVGPKYCYLNENLRSLRVTPYIYFLPTVGESTLSIGNLSKEWAGNWQKIIGGNNSLKLEFTGSKETRFLAPYIVENSAGNLTVNFLNLDKNQKGSVSFSGQNISSITLLPSAQGKTSVFSDTEPSYQYSWSISTAESGDDQVELIKALQAQIELILAEINRIQAQINAILNQGGQQACQRFENNLYYGLKNNSEVRCLQEFLKNQGQIIYPEGLITGNFGNLTQLAVIRFQERYASEILKPLGYEKGTGFVGSATRAKINQLLGK